MQASNSLLMASLACDRRSVEEPVAAGVPLEAILITSYLILDQLDFRISLQGGKSVFHVAVSEETPNTP